jgi:hypothetical protein
MAINMNYSLLSGDNTDNFKIPLYGNGNTEETYSESYFMTAIAEFNQELREASYALSEVRYDSDYLTESNVLVNIKNTIKTIVEKVIDAIMKLAHTVIKALQSVLNLITKRNKEVIYKDKIVTEYRMHDRMTLLAKILADNTDGYTLNISSITPTPELLSKSFPNTNAIGTDLVGMIDSSVKNYVANYKAKNGKGSYSSDADASEGLATFVNSEKSRILDNIFGKYQYDPTNIIGSARDVSVKAFGSTEPKETKLTVALYSQACDNIENADKSIIDSLKSDLKVFEKSYNDTIKSLKNLKSDFIKHTSNYTVNSNGDPIKTHNDIRTGFANATDTVVKNLNTIINTVNVAISANVNLMSHKIKRIDQVYSANGDAAKVRLFAHRLINEYMKTDDQMDSRVNQSMQPAFESFLGEQDKFDTALIMLEECWLENEFNAYVEQVILEDGEAGNANTASSGETTQQSAQPAGDKQSQSQQNTQNQQQQKSKTSNPNDNNSIIKLINNIVDNVITMFDKFKNRLFEVAIKLTDGKFWNKNREKIRVKDFSKATANDWYSYDFDALSKSVIVTREFDIKSETLKDDETFQNTILNTINPAKPQFEKDDDTFTTKVAKRYYTNYVDKNAQEVALGSLGTNGYNHQKAFAFVDGIIRGGIRDKYISAIDKDTEDLKKAQKLINTNKQVLADRLQDKAADNAQPVNPTPQHNSAIIVDGKFNLAECFGLPEKRYSGELPFISIDEAITMPANEIEKSGDGSDGKESMSEADARIKRFFKYESMAVTARMTAVMSAYKQYMNLYKIAFGVGKTKVNNSNRAANTNNNQQQQQQNQAQENNQNQQQDQQQK